MNRVEGRAWARRPETLDLFVPGGGLAVKLVKTGYDLARSKKK